MNPTLLDSPNNLQINVIYCFAVKFQNIHKLKYSQVRARFCCSVWVWSFFKQKMSYKQNLQWSKS